MKFIVCIKQVPDVTSSLYLRDGAVVAEAGRMVLNAYDASAIEGTLVLAESLGGRVHVVLVGPSQARETIRKALAMGADSAVHLCVEDGTALDARAVAQMLSDHLAGESFDVIACGKQAQDTDEGLTGSMLAELLGLPFVANAVGLDVDGDRIVVVRQGDAARETVLLETPCLVTCSNDMNDPRIPTLRGIMAASRKPIELRTVGIPVDLPAVRVLRHVSLPERRTGRVLEGTPAEAVEELVRLLKREAKVL